MTDAEIDAWIDHHGVYHPEAIALIGPSRYGGGLGEETERRMLLRRALSGDRNRLYGMTAATGRGF